VNQTLKETVYHFHNLKANIFFWTFGQVGVNPAEQAILNLLGCIKNTKKKELNLSALLTTMEAKTNGNQQ
jgi:hypothetical protein